MGGFLRAVPHDAVTASRELQLTLTARDRERQVPMCRVPYHAVESYLTRLLGRRFPIAICEQMEDPKPAKKIVKREAIRAPSPGTAMDAALGQEQNNFLAAYFEAGAHAAGAKAQSVLGSQTYGLKPVPDAEETSGELPPNRKSAVRMGHPQSRANPHSRAVCAVALLDVSTGSFGRRSLPGLRRGRRLWTRFLWRGQRGATAESAQIPAGLERAAARTRVEDSGDLRFCRAAGGAATEGEVAGGVRAHRARWSGYRRWCGAALRAHDAEERGAAH